MSRISPHALIAALIVLALLDASYAGALYWREARANPATLSLWSLIFLSVTVWWIDVDSRRHADIYRPFEFGQLVFLTSPIYLPYYLWRTRRGAGLWMLAGFITLFEAGGITHWAVFALR